MCNTGGLGTAVVITGLLLNSIYYSLSYLDLSVLVYDNISTVPNPSKISVQIRSAPLTRLVSRNKVVLTIDRLTDIVLIDSHSISSKMTECKDVSSPFGIGNDIEQYGNDTSSYSSASSPDYHEGTKRISAVSDTEIIVIAIRASRISEKSPEDPEKIHNPEFEVKWDGPADPQNALNWSKLRKYCILALVSLQAWMVYVHLALLNHQIPY